MAGGGVVRHAAKQVSASREIFYGMTLAIIGGIGWRGWHLSYKAQVADYYAQLQAKNSDN